MTSTPHPWEKLREAQLSLVPTSTVAQLVDLILDNARVRADDAVYAVNRKDTDISWHDLAVTYTRKQLARSRNRVLLDWFARHGVTP